MTLEETVVHNSFTKETHMHANRRVHLYTNTHVYACKILKKKDIPELCFHSILYQSPFFIKSLNLGPQILL